MKITNPTVFLRDGELFCLTVEVPKEPDRNDYYLLHYESAMSTAQENYIRALAQAKSSAVKVKNRTQTESFMRLTHHNSDLDAFLPDYFYTLTGYEAEVNEVNEFMAARYKVATISPVHKEESQEVNELIQKVHEDMEGRYDLTGEDLYFIHAALCDLALLKRKV